jgi:hypothetical protein
VDPESKVAESAEDFANRDKALPLFFAQTKPLEIGDPEGGSDQLA